MKHEPTVYIIKIGKFLKIGFTTNLTSRMSAFHNTSPDVTVLATFPGDRATERRLHGLLKEVRVTRELFHFDGRVQSFIGYIERGDVAGGFAWLSERSPERRAKRDATERRARVRERRKSKAELDAHFASMVMDRKQRIGW